MRISLFFWLIIFLLGVLVGDRYGAPGWASRISAGAFTAVERWFGKLDEPIPNAADAVEDVSADASITNESLDENAPDNSQLRINEAGLEIIKESEGLELEAYNLYGQWLIGYGHARTAEPGMTITEAEAERLLREDVAYSENAVRELVVVPINENQFSALVSLAYNLGSTRFSNSSVFELLNNGDYQGAADAFIFHDRARINGELQSIPHLTERRAKERELFLRPVN
ncbi:lysozyme [Hyphococcus formosus]|uniref:lysozyme n=1 Tax=Hyphococcus formosus TaxID=3143534 RepID=UPI00398A73C4